MAKQSTAVTTDPRDNDESAVLLAALNLITEKGYHNTSLADIAGLSGLKSSNAIYKFFKNKQAIAEALYDNILDSLSCSIDEIRRTKKKPAEQLREIISLLFVLTEEAPDVMRFIFLVRHQEFLPGEKSLQQSPPFVKLRKIMQSGIKSGEIRITDATRAYTYFFGVIEHTLRMILTGALKKKATTYQEEAWTIAWQTVSRNTLAESSGG